MYADLPERHASILHTYAQGGDQDQNRIHAEIMKFQSNDTPGTMISVAELNRLHEVEKIAAKLEQQVKIELVSTGTQTDGVETSTGSVQTVSKWVSLDSISNAALSMGGNIEPTSPPPALSLTSHSQGSGSEEMEAPSMRHARSMPTVRSNPDASGMARRLPSRGNMKALTKKSMASPYNDDQDWIKLEKDAKRIETAYQKSIPNAKKPVKKSKVLLSAIEVNEGRPSTHQQMRPSTNQQSRGGGERALQATPIKHQGGLTPLGSVGGPQQVVVVNLPRRIQGDFFEEGEQQTPPRSGNRTPIAHPVIPNCDQNMELCDFLNQYDDLALQIQTQNGKTLSAPVLMKKIRSRAASGPVTPTPGPRAPAALPKKQEEDNLVEYLNSYDDLATQLQVRLEESEQEIVEDQERIRAANGGYNSGYNSYGNNSGGSSSSNNNGNSRNIARAVRNSDLPPGGGSFQQRPRSPSITSVDSLLSIDSQGSVGSTSSLVSPDNGGGAASGSPGSRTHGRVTTAAGSGSPTRRRKKSKAEPTTNKEKSEAKENPGLAVVNRARDISSSNKADREKPLSKTEKQLTESPLAEPYFSRIKKSETPAYVYFYDQADSEVARQRGVDPAAMPSRGAPARK